MRIHCHHHQMPEHAMLEHHQRQSFSIGGLSLDCELVRDAPDNEVYWQNLIRLLAKFIIYDLRRSLAVIHIGDLSG